jgi:hypothetical protein
MLEKKARSTKGRFKLGLNDELEGVIDSATHNHTAMRGGGADNTGVWLVGGATLPDTLPLGGHYRENGMWLVAQWYFGFFFSLPIQNWNRHSRSERRLFLTAIATMSRARGATTGVDQIVKLIVGAGQASPSPPVGPALGSKGVKSMDFCKV